MLNALLLENLLFLDIETVPAEQSFQALSIRMQELWSEKFAKIEPESKDTATGFQNRAGIYAEFGKIVCISAGYFYENGGQKKLRIKSFFDDNEAILLRNFLETTVQFAKKIPGFIFCGHNIKEFDIPYICRRAIINRLDLPEQLHLYGKKPWEVNMLDTLHLWRFGDHKNYTSLNLLATILDVPTPKDDIDGSKVAEVYWQQQDLSRIAAYCQKDVLTVAQLVLRFKQLPLLTEENIEFVS
ncbi:MAG: 3'-5' exonuclease [Chitinophagaceae bacterium]|nr:MAG: 3'-5' exonuclease [Chitinophagaceae bacterium]